MVIFLFSASNYSCSGFGLFKGFFELTLPPRPIGVRCFRNFKKCKDTVRSVDLGAQVQQIRIELMTRLDFRHQIEELYLMFAKKASAFNSWFENAEEDMTDPVRCNSLEEIFSLKEAHRQFQQSLSSATADFEALAQLDKQIKKWVYSTLK